MKVRLRALKVGSWKCSTLVAALSGNEAAVERAVAIDWWSGGEDFLATPRVACEAHLAQFVDAPFREGGRLRLLERDCFSVEPSQLLEPDGGRRYNVYFYDGPHERYDHLRAFTHFDTVLADVFIAVVDDWNHEPVRAGTAEAFAALGYSVAYGEVLGGGRGNNRNTVGTGPWHNGVYLAVVCKRKTGVPLAPHSEGSATSAAHGL